MNAKSKRTLMEKFFNITGLKPYKQFFLSKPSDIRPYRLRYDLKIEVAKISDVRTRTESWELSPISIYQILSGTFFKIDYEKTFVARPLFIVTNGFGGSGKDTFVKCIPHSVDTLKYSIIDPIKEVALKLGWSEIKTEESRKFLCGLKQLSDNYNDFPFEHLVNTFRNRLEEPHFGAHPCFVFADMRNPKDIKRFKERFDCLTVYIDNPNNKPILSNPEDAGVMNYDYDIIIHNNSNMEDFFNIAHLFTHSILDFHRYICPDVMYNSPKMFDFFKTNQIVYDSKFCTLKTQLRSDNN